MHPQELEVDLPPLRPPELTYYGWVHGESFATLVQNNFFAGRRDHIVRESWDGVRGVLYVAVRDDRGLIHAEIFRDRGPATLAHILHRGISSFHEAECPPFHHCSREFVALLSPTDNKRAMLWRALAGKFADTCARS